VLARHVGPASSCGGVSTERPQRLLGCGVDSDEVHQDSYDAVKSYGKITANGRAGRLL
jgi:hypothetical protein